VVNVRIPAIVLAAVWAAACASTGGVPRPFPTPGPRPPAAAPPAPSPAAGGPVDGFVVAGTALQYRGTPYRFGGADPAAGFDCSGLVQYVYAQHGVAVPRDVQEQYHTGSRVRPQDVQPGDLLFFATEGRDASHVAIAISSRQFVHAPSSNGVVRVEALNAGYWSARYLGARRLLDTSR
jgi:cell wall-associated NlpC family hydrolase